jgi:hypothetical protein
LRRVFMALTQLVGWSLLFGRHCHDCYWTFNVCRWVGIGS